MNIVHIFFDSSLHSLLCLISFGVLFTYVIKKDENAEGAKHAKQYASRITSEIHKSLTSENNVINNQLLIRDKIRTSQQNGYFKHASDYLVNDDMSVEKVINSDILKYRGISMIVIWGVLTVIFAVLHFNTVYNNNDKNLYKAFISDKDSMISIIMSAIILFVLFGIFEYNFFVEYASHVIPILPSQMYNIEKKALVSFYNI